MFKVEIGYLNAQQVAASLGAAADQVPYAHGAGIEQVGGGDTQPADPADMAGSNPCPQLIVHRRITDHPAKVVRPSVIVG